MRTVRKTCNACFGSGRDPVTGTGTCSLCNGTGKIYEQVIDIDGGGGGGVSGSGGSDLSAGFAALLVLGFAVANYVLTADLILGSRLDYQMTRQTDWPMVGAVAGASLVLVGIFARLFGVLPALLAGTVPTLPAWVGTGGGIGVVAIVFNPTEQSDFSVLFAWTLGIGTTLFHLYVALLLQPSGRRGWQRLFSRSRGTFTGGRLVLAGIGGVVLLILAVAVLQSLRRFV